MDYISLLHNFKQFYPNPKDKVLIYYDKKTIEEVVITHYENISPTIASDIETKFKERGYIKTITGRKIFEEPIVRSLYSHLIVSSVNDIWSLIIGSFYGTIDDSVFCICDEREIPLIKKNCQEVIESLKLRTKYWIDFKVVHDESDNS